jgi:hypothetical protein
VGRGRVGGRDGNGKKIEKMVIQDI